jgi:hypothetical protein
LAQPPFVPVDDKVVADLLVSAPAEVTVMPQTLLDDATASPTANDVTIDAPPTSNLVHGDSSVHALVAPDHADVDPTIAEAAVQITDPVPSAVDNASPVEDGAMADSLAISGPDDAAAPSTALASAKVPSSSTTPALHEPVAVPVAAHPDKLAGIPADPSAPVDTPRSEPVLPLASPALEQSGCATAEQRDDASARPSAVSSPVDTLPLPASRGWSPALQPQHSASEEEDVIVVDDAALVSDVRSEGWAEVQV